MVSTVHTLFWYLQALASDHPRTLFLGDKNGWITAGQALRFVEIGAGALYSHGLRRGMPVAIPVGRSVNSILALLCLQRIGAVAVLIDPRESPEKALSACTPPMAVSLCLEAEEDVSPPVLRLTKAGESSVLSLPLGSSSEALAPPHDDPGAPAFYIFTSGSSGKKKVVVLSQGNLVSNLLDSAPLGGYSEKDVALGALPMDHVFGLALLTGAIVLRHRLYLTAETAPKELLQIISKQKITRMNGVPSLYLSMAEMAADSDVRSLRVGYIGGAPWTVRQFRHIESALGMTLVPVYGMSECIGISCASYRSPKAVRMTGVGPFYPANQGKILREDGAPARAGEAGEICVRGPMRMLGYYDPVQTSEAIDQDGFLHTGDVGFVDEDGILHLTGRRKDVIIRNGINLSPQRVEEALLSLPGVHGAAVVGLPDRTCGELPWAAVVCAEEVLPGLMDGLRPLLAKNELPAGILRVNALPMTDSGKPNKQSVRELIQRWRTV